MTKIFFIHFAITVVLVYNLRNQTGGTEMTNHAHIYMIESPNGPRSNGRCKECGQRKEFGNSIEEAYQMTHGPDANLYNQFKSPIGKEQKEYHKLDNILKQMD